MKISIKNRLLLTALITGLGLIMAGRATAQTFTNVCKFIGGNDGYNPQAGLIVSGNTLYGVCDSGGNSDIGTVFAVNTDGSGYRILHNFTFPFCGGISYPTTNSDGAYP